MVVYLQLVGPDWIWAEWGIEHLTVLIKVWSDERIWKMNMLKTKTALSLTSSDIWCSPKVCLPPSGISEYRRKYVAAPIFSSLSFALCCLSAKSLSIEFLLHSGTVHFAESSHSEETLNWPRMLSLWGGFQQKRLSSGGKAKQSGRFSRGHNAMQRAPVPFKIASTMLDSSLNTVSPLQTSGFVALPLGQSPLCRHKKCFWTFCCNRIFPRLLFLDREKKLHFWSHVMETTHVWHWVRESDFNETTRPCVQQQVRKDWCRCVKTGQFLVVFSILIWGFLDIPVFIRRIGSV